MARRHWRRGMRVVAFTAVAAVAGAFALMDALLEDWRVAETTVAIAPPVSETPAVAAKPKLRKPETVRILASVEQVKDRFSNVGYNLDAVRKGEVAVPRIQHASLPYDLMEIDQPKERKAVFLRFMLPYVLQANKRVSLQRAKLLRLRSRMLRGEELAPDENSWLDALFDEYRLKRGDFASLVARVDTVPPSLALAQSAIESGWGTSRFAHEGNAPFGQWTSQDYEGIVPSDRSEGKTHKIRAFNHLRDAVDSYLRNLNTHGAYRKLRKMRSSLRKQGAPLDSVAIAAMLSSYAEKGSDYVKLVRRIIRENNLRALDRAKLGERVIVLRRSEPGA